MVSSQCSQGNLAAFSKHMVQLPPCRYLTVLSHSSHWWHVRFLLWMLLYPITKWGKKSLLVLSRKMVEFSQHMIGVNVQFLSAHQAEQQLYHRAGYICTDLYQCSDQQNTKEQFHWFVFLPLNWQKWQCLRTSGKKAFIEPYNQPGGKRPLGSSSPT